MTSAKEFVDFWLENSVHADEQFGVRRGRPAIDELVQRLLVAAKAQGFSEEQVQGELGGDIHAIIRARIDEQNAKEAFRLKRERFAARVCCLMRRKSALPGCDPCRRSVILRGAPCIILTKFKANTNALLFPPHDAAR
ncbi:hypothetical protein H8B02_17345 [Bradyrhizobium sp. Pear77]|uniref:hypothetical protein n=1 Tax=Bradyrhizobium altum TaxID=1571202 RepID=UPI001E3126F2|nr:hypothetical protein [Bradyrhizobium altum]MCC8955145.1 hypothetical protein [Bradyrhizobium altum]